MTTKTAILEAKKSRLGRRIIRAFNAFELDAINSKRYSESTIKSRRDRFWGGKDMCIGLYFSNLSISSLNKFNIACARKLFRTICSNFTNWNTISARTGVTRKFIEYCMGHDFIPYNNFILRIFHQKQEPPKPSEILTDEQIEFVRNVVYSNDHFYNIRAKLIFWVFIYIKGIRPEVEIERISIHDIKIKSEGIEMKIRGKKGRIRLNYLPPEYIEILVEYIKLRKNILIKNNAIHEKALIIKKYFHGIQSSNKTYALSRNGIYNILYRLKKKYPNQLKGISPYTFRRTAITRIVRMAKLNNIPLDEVAANLGTTVAILKKHYDADHDFGYNELYKDVKEAISSLTLERDYYMELIKKEPKNKGVYQLIIKKIEEQLSTYLLYQNRKELQTEEIKNLKSKI